MYLHTGKCREEKEVEEKRSKEEREGPSHEAFLYHEKAEDCTLEL